MAIAGIHESCPLLRDLDLSKCTLTPSILRNIATMGALTRLQISGGVTAEGFAILGTMRLTDLSLRARADDDDWTEASVRSLLVDSNLSRTLEALELNDGFTMQPISDHQVALALACCPNLKTLDVDFQEETCVFGRSGLAGLQAIAAGCPSLALFSLQVTVDGIHSLGTQFPQLKKCWVKNRFSEEGAASPEGFPSPEELKTLYPTVKVRYEMFLPA